MDRKFLILTAALVVISLAIIPFFVNEKEDEGLGAYTYTMVQ